MKALSSHHDKASVLLFHLQTIPLCIVLTLSPQAFSPVLTASIYQHHGNLRFEQLPPMLRASGQAQSL